ncbi:septum formation family protein [Streptomyces sp. NPDC017958]|uniref:septum formation family protein n=1 Tax=Streptomyces sp. NPDC017958 TaxID=3365021 RepID=UPI0037898E4C
MSAIPLPTPSEPGSQRNQKRRKLAIAGVLALGGVALAMSRIIGAISGDAEENPDKRMSGAGDRSAVSLAVGDCFTSSQHKEVYSAVPVPCSRPHDGEVFATVALTGSISADDVLAKRSYHQCSDRLTDYVMDDWSLPHTMGVNYYYPTREVQQSGNRTAACFTADTDGQTTGSVREQETSLAADQLAFLRLELASARVFKTYPHQGSTAANRVWAAKMAAALDHEADGLNVANWSPGAKPKVTAYVGELRKSAQLWRKAVAARSDDSYWARSDDAWPHPSYTYQRDVREALRLASDVPATSFGPPF